MCCIVQSVTIQPTATTAWQVSGERTAITSVSWLNVLFYKWVCCPDQCLAACRFDHSLPTHSQSGRSRNCWGAPQKSNVSHDPHHSRKRREGCAEGGVCLYEQTAKPSLTSQDFNWISHHEYREGFDFLIFLMAANSSYLRFVQVSNAISLTNRSLYF